MRGSLRPFTVCKEQFCLHIRVEVGPCQIGIIGFQLAKQRPDLPGVILCPALQISNEPMFATRFMSSLLYGVSPTDPMVLSLTALLLTGIVMMAAYLPAERATRVDPASVLRYE